MYITKEFAVYSSLSKETPESLEKEGWLYILDYGPYADLVELRGLCLYTVSRFARLYESLVCNWDKTSKEWIFYDGRKSAEDIIIYGPLN